MKRPLRFSMSLSILFLSPMSAIVSAAVDIPLSLSSEKNYIVEVVLPGGSTSANIEDGRERISSRAPHTRIGEQRLLCESFYIRADGSKLLWRHISLSGGFVRKLTVEPDSRCEKSRSCLERSPEDCCISVQYGRRGRSFPNFVRWGTTSGAVYPGCSLCYSRNRRGRNLAREFHR